MNMDVPTTTLSVGKPTVYRLEETAGKGTRTQQIERILDELEKLREENKNLKKEIEKLRKKLDGGENQ